MTDETSPILLWFRRDLRLSDHPALSAACSSGRPVIPVFLLDEVAEALERGRQALAAYQAGYQAEKQAQAGS